MVYHLSILQCNTSLYAELLCLRKQGDVRSSRLQYKPSHFSAKVYPHCNWKPDKKSSWKMNSSVRGEAQASNYVAEL